MRGTDLTEWQIKAAEKFCRRNSSTDPIDDDQSVSLRFGDLVRMVAWYGQIRAKAVEAGAPADTPGETHTVTTGPVSSQNTTIPYSSPAPKEGKVLAMTKSDGGDAL